MRPSHSSSAASHRAKCPPLGLYFRKKTSGMITAGLGSAFTLHSRCNCHARAVTWRLRSFPVPCRLRESRTRGLFSPSSSQLAVFYLFFSSPLQGAKKRGHIRQEFADRGYGDDKTATDSGSTGPLADTERRRGATDLSRPNNSPSGPTRSFSATRRSGFWVLPLPPFPRAQPSVTQSSILLIKLQPELLHAADAPIGNQSRVDDKPNCIRQC